MDMWRRSFHRCGYFVLLLGPLLARAQTDPIAIAGTLITPQGIVQQGAVLIQDGRILAIGA